MSTGMMGHVHAHCRISTHSHMQQQFTHLQSLKGWQPARRQAVCYRTVYCAAQSASTQQSREAIVLVDHGSKRAEANAMLDQFAEMYRSTSERQLVKTAHMELAQPTIADAIAECVDAGADKVIVAPFFLSRGRHITEDIPALVEAAAAQHPGVQCVIADPLGTDELLAQLMEKRVQAAVAQAAQQ